MEIDDQNDINGDIVLPGDDVTSLINNESIKKTKTVIGPGLRREGDKILVTRCGVINNFNKSRYWIYFHQKRYVPVKGDRVIGIVVSKTSNFCKVDIGSHELAILQLIAFEGATKRNKPHIDIGDIVYAQITLAIKHMEPELTCITSQMKKDGMGVLPKQGFAVTVPLEVARRLLSPECSFLENIGKKFKSEFTVGHNGRIWVDTMSFDNTIAICRLLNQLEHLNFDQYDIISEQIIQEFESAKRHH